MLYEIENSKREQSQLVAAIDLCDGQDTELLLCYNRNIPLIIILNLLIKCSSFFS